MPIHDGAEKLRFVLEQATAAQAIADAVDDDHHRRVFARGVFVAVNNFISLAQQYRNTLAETHATRAGRKEAKQLLHDLRDRDWASFSQLRDRLSAHRQPVDGQDGPEGWASATALWEQIDASLIGVLLEDMRRIYNTLATAANEPEFVSPRLHRQGRKALRAAVRRPPSDGLRVDTGSFGEARSHMIAVILPGAAGERLREISDTATAFELLVDAYVPVRGRVPFQRAVVAALVIEVSNLLELVFEVPAGRAPANRYAPLVDILPAGSPEKQVLDRRRAALPRPDVESLMELRNTVAAHVDPERPFSSLISSLDGVAPTRLQTTWNFVEGALIEANESSPMTTLRPLFALRDVALEGITRIDAPAFRTVYDR